MDGGPTVQTEFDPSPDPIAVPPVRQPGPDLVHETLRQVAVGREQRGASPQSSAVPVSGEEAGLHADGQRGKPGRKGRRRRDVESQERAEGERQEDQGCVADHHDVSQPRPHIQRRCFQRGKRRRPVTNSRTSIN